MLIFKIIGVLVLAVVPAYEYYKNRLWKRGKTFDSF